MTPYEAIKYCKTMAKNARNEIINRDDLEPQEKYYNSQLEFHARETEQLAAWLKELYDKAVDDFVHECDKCCGFYNGKNKNITREDILKIAEKLKTYGDARD